MNLITNRLLKSYLGAYLLIEDEYRSIKKNRTIFKNENTGKVFREEIKFDPQTGDPISKINEEYTDCFLCRGFGDFIDGYEKDCFLSSEHIDCPEGYTILLPCSKMEHGSSCDYGADITWEILEGDMEKSKQEFSEKFSKEIKALNDFYEKVEVKFGVIIYSEYYSSNY